MGEYAEMMLDGDCCSSCGEYIGDGDGFPRQCEGCRRADRYEPRVPRFNRYAVKPSPPRADQIGCDECGKVVKRVGLAQHKRDVHKGSEQ